jgi:hypothetical protein
MIFVAIQILAVTSIHFNKHRCQGHITLPYLADEELVDKAVEDAFGDAA